MISKIAVIYTTAITIIQKVLTLALVAVAIISLICPISSAKTNTPISQAAVMNKYSMVFSGFGFFPIEVAVLVAK